jgi:hypothetical protein
VSAIPGVNSAYEEESPALQWNDAGLVSGAPWVVDWRDNYPIASDEILNHTTPVYLGILDGTEGVTDWNPWEGVTGPHPSTVIRFGYGTPGIQEYANDAPLAIDQRDRHPDHGQAQLSGQSSIAALVPFLELPDAGIGTNDLGEYTLPYHFDVGNQVDGSAGISPRQVFRQPPTYSDQTAGVVAAGF